tara:strand:+ start:33 stop:335 length:303 start_codon:yes stop_codon:yes gene_type:complete
MSDDIVTLSTSDECPDAGRSAAASRAIQSQSLGQRLTISFLSLFNLTVQYIPKGFPTAKKKNVSAFFSHMGMENKVMAILGPRTPWRRLLEKSNGMEIAL